MNRIVFNHDYCKLWGQNKAQLLQCVKVMRCEIDDDALDYDTEYTIRVYDAKYYDSRLNQDFYAFEDGDYLRLLLMGDKGIPFTTYRKDNAENREKYMNAVGDWFEIYVQEESK